MTSLPAGAPSDARGHSVKGQQVGDEGKKAYMGGNGSWRLVREVGRARWIVGEKIGKREVEEEEKM